jgi:DNA-binding LacI/PurR family transcriptional regulator
MTVSLALRNDRSVSAATCGRIQKLARSLGYRPDPMLTHLMQHLRASRTTKAGVNLAVLATLNAPFVQRLIDGATTRAARLGYTLDRIDLRAFTDKPAALTRMLSARGVAGVLLGPSADPCDYSTLLDWGKFAAVAMTYSVFEPRVHRVVTHHYDNAIRTFALLDHRGLKRIGMIMTRDMEFRSNHSYSGAYFRAGRMTGAKTVPILYLDDSPRREIQTWFDRHRLQAVVVANAGQVGNFLLPALGQKRCAKTAFACLDYEAESKVAGMDQRFEIIGSHAIDALVAQIHRSERGLPEDPTSSMVEGHWTELSGLYPFRK